MSELLSMLVPLNGTLPGWPSHNQFDILTMLLILIGIPVAGGLLAMGLGWVSAIQKTNRGGKLLGPWVQHKPDAAALTALDAKSKRELSA